MIIRPSPHSCSMLQDHDDVTQWSNAFKNDSDVGVDVERLGWDRQTLPSMGMTVRERGQNSGRKGKRVITPSSPDRRCVCGAQHCVNVGTTRCRGLLPHRQDPSATGLSRALWLALCMHIICAPDNLGMDSFIRIDAHGRTANTGLGIGCFWECFLLVIHTHPKIHKSSIVVLYYAQTRLSHMSNTFSTTCRAPPRMAEREQRKYVRVERLRKGTVDEGAYCVQKSTALSLCDSAAIHQHSVSVFALCHSTHPFNNFWTQITCRRI